MISLLTGILSSLAGWTVQKAAGWGISNLIRSPVGWAAGGLVGLFVVYQIGNYHGFKRAAERCNEAAALAKLHALQRDNQIQEQAKAMAEQERAAASKLAEDLERKVADYEASLTKRRDHCRLTADDVRRLRALGQ